MATFKRYSILLLLCLGLSWDAHAKWWQDLGYSSEAEGVAAAAARNQAIVNAAAAQQAAAAVAEAESETLAILGLAALVAERTGGGPVWCPTDDAAIFVLCLTLQSK